MEILVNGVVALKTKTVFLVGLLTSLLVLAGCGSANNNESNNGNSIHQGTLKLLEPYKKINYKKLKFKGPYKKGLEKVAKEYKHNNFVLSVIKDSIITSDDIDIASKIENSCTTELGFNIEYKYSQGYMPPENDFWAYTDITRVIIQLDDNKNWTEKEITKMEKKCYKYSGFEPLLSLYQNMMSNPENRDRLQEVANCLIKNKMVPKNYTKYKLKKDFNNIENKTQNSKSNPLNKYIGINASMKNQQKFFQCQIKYKPTND